MAVADPQAPFTSAKINHCVKDTTGISYFLHHPRKVTLEGSNCTSQNWNLRAVRWQLSSFPLCERWLFFCQHGDCAGTPTSVLLFFGLWREKKQSQMWRRIIFSSTFPLQYDIILAAASYSASRLPNNCFFFCEVFFFFFLVVVCLLHLMKTQNMPALGLQTVESQMALNSSQWTGHNESRLCFPVSLLRRYIQSEGSYCLQLFLFIMVIPYFLNNFACVHIVHRIFQALELQDSVFQPQQL